MSGPARTAVAVSEHAVLRYLERVKGVDVAAARDELAAAVRASALIGSPYCWLDGRAVILRNGCVVTVLARGVKPAIDRRTGLAVYGDPDGFAERRGGRA